MKRFQYIIAVILSVIVSAVFCLFFISAMGFFFYAGILMMLHEKPMIALPYFAYFWVLFVCLVAFVKEVANQKKLATEPSKI